LKDEEINKIERYLNGKSSLEERDWVESLFSKGENNEFLKDLVRRDWDDIIKDPSVPEADLHHLLDRVHHTIHKNEILKKKKPLQRFINVYSRIAALLLLPLLVGGGLFFRHQNQIENAPTDQEVKSIIYAPLGSRVSFNLPDGTDGMLNSGSFLSYSLPFSNNRKIKLEGEAWFEVKHDKSHPFEINAGSSTVKVLGTSLNVNAYPSEEYVEVVLKQGEVEFLDKNGEEPLTMRPSERLVYKHGNITKSVTDPAKYNAWTEGKLVFRGDPMAEVARRIERWYNVKVNIADSELEKYSFRATFNDDTLEDVMHFLSMTSPISYSITPRIMSEDGTYKKEEVTIFKKKIILHH